VSDFLLKINKANIGILGLGYVGLPLALAFETKYKTTAFDVSKSRIQELLRGQDKTREVTSKELYRTKNCNFTNYVRDLKFCNTFIVTVPTPIDKYKRPNLKFLKLASETVSEVLTKGDVVIYESTVYPGATEEVCVPIIENISGLTYNVDFFVGYSPERINPGDKNRRLTDVKKVTSGSNEACANFVDDLYGSIIEAGTFKAKNIKTAEAAKVIENIQRDVNIALINELAILFKKIGVQTKDVLEAASSKWNFLDFKPGLVGGHCIGVDPYYLTHKAQEVGHNPELILAGRRLNDSMAHYIADKVLLELFKRRETVVGLKVLLMGLTFKENCPDIRNTKIFDIYEYLKNLGILVDVYDPWADHEEVKKNLKITLVSNVNNSSYNAIIVAVAHNEFKKMGFEKIKKFGEDDAVIYDIKNIFPDGSDCIRL
tara:strand:- start:186 stop:1475 length:1290 start_codon:yes stop_codon:yes gene_type:complete